MPNVVQSALRKWGKGAPKKVKLSDRALVAHKAYPHQSTKEIADTLTKQGHKTTASSVARFLRRAGQSSPRGRRRAEHSLDEKVQDHICKAYESGLSIRHLAGLLRVGYTSVRSVLLYNGIEIRGRPKITEDALERARCILEWRAEGFTLEECGKDLGLTRQGAHRFERRAKEWEKKGML